MTRARLNIAFVLSAILIITATWVRFSRASVVKVENLAAVPQAGNSLEGTAKSPEEIAAELSTPTDTATSTAPLTTTDLVGRQMMSDFLGMAANGQVSDDSIQNLANTYANNVGNLATAVQIDPTDLNVVADTAKSLTDYTDTLTAIYTKYGALAAAEPTAGKDFTKVGPDLVAFAKNMANLYEKESKELQTMPVPASLLVDQTKLVNNFLSSEANMQALATADTDPMAALGAGVAQAKNSQDEQTILADIKNVLLQSGIISSSQ